MDAQTIEKLLVGGIPEAQVEAVDLQGGDHFQVTVVSPAFEGLSMVQQHRLVYAALGDSMREAIHALVIKTLTPDQYRAELVGNLD